MNKDKLQKEILEKIKPGTKPSDLKKKSKKRLNSPPPMEISKSDSSYESDQSNKSISKASPLSNSQIKDLQSQITALQKQLKVYKDFKEADLKIKEGYKETIADLTVKNSELNKTIETIKIQVKSTANIKSEPTETKTFTCSDCNQQKPQSELSRIFGNFSFCLECSKKARQTATQQKQKPQPVDFICHLCEQSKTEIPHLIKLDQTLTEYNICSACKPTAKEFNEAELITDDLWAKYPYSSASEILELEFGIVRK